MVIIFVIKTNTRRIVNKISFLWKIKSNSFEGLASEKETQHFYYTVDHLVKRSR